MNDHSSQISSPKSAESGSNSKFKTLKKKIRNKFRLSRTEDVKTIAQAVETLKRSGELMTQPNDDSERLKNEFKELRETLESIVNQNQVLAEVVKSVDSCCPDPFNEPEKFSVYFAQKSLNSRSLSEEFEAAELPKAPEATSIPVNDNKSAEVENALLRLQNLRMEEQRRFATERENYETRIAQVALLQQEIELLRKQNSEHELQLEFLKSQNSSSESDSVIANLKAELATLCQDHAAEMTQKNDSIHETSSKLEAAIARNNELESEIASLHSKMEELTNQNAAKDEELKEIAKTVQDLQHEMTEEKQPVESAENINSALVDELRSANSNLQGQLDAALEKLKSLQETSENSEDKDFKFREISEENARLKIDLNDLKQELKELKSELADFEKQPVSSVNLEEEKKSPNESDESAFKYVYLSNLVLKFMQFPDQRPQLSNIILTTLQSDQAYFQKAMGQK